MHRKHHWTVHFAVALAWGLAAALWPAHPAWRRCGVDVGRKET